MNAKYSIFGIGFVVGVAGSTTSVIAQTCSDNAGLSPYVCVDWSLGADPEEGTDFLFDFETDADNPGVTLRVGDDGWEIWSQVSWTDTAAANLGAIKIDATVLSDSFAVSVVNGTGAGAANVGSINLDDPGVNWTGHTSINAGTITGNVGARTHATAS